MIAYITAKVPWGRGETFIINEMLAMKKAGVDLFIIPRTPSREVFHREGESLLENSIWLPLFGPKILGVFLISLFIKPCLWKIIGKILLYSRSGKILIKNLAVVPKSVYIAAIANKRGGVEHIHAHWGSTTSTMAWIVSELTGIPWSFTLHRWDIKENNLLKLKVKKASFVRCISEDGRREVLSIVGETYRDKVRVLHMGVTVPETLPKKSWQLNSKFIIACPASLLPVKGHRFLIEACYLLVKKGIKNIQCLLIGDGPLEKEIRVQINMLRLEKIVKLTGRLPHNKIIEMYRHGRIQAVVLPSILTVNGEKEGIPVALMEAMAYGIPVISTNIGGIPELLSDMAGIMVREKNAKQIAEAIESLIEDRKLYRKIGGKGYTRVKESFDIEKNVKRLLYFINLSTKTNFI